jgi:integrase
VLGSTTLRKLTTHSCELWANGRGKGLAASTYNNERDTLILVMAYAQREGLLLGNPAATLPRRRMPKNSVVIPSREQFSKLVETLRTGGSRRADAARLVELLAYSGMRLAEATALRWRDVHFDQTRFTVTGGVDGTKNHEVREVPLFPALRAFLERIRGESKDPETEAGALIVGIANAKRAMEYACKGAGLPDFTHHAMRHYFVSNAIEAGVDFKTIAGWVGHKDGGLLVAKTYGHLRDTHSHEMAKKMTFSAA